MEFLAERQEFSETDVNPMTQTRNKIMNAKVDNTVVMLRVDLSGDTDDT